MATFKKSYNEQRKIVFRSFARTPKTMLQVAIETNVLRANICRIVAELRKKNQITLINKGICPISKHRAGFYITTE